MTTPEEFTAKLHGILDDDDPETEHAAADNLVAALLRELGYGDAMDLLLGRTRWFA